MAKHKQTKSTDIPERIKRRVRERDGNCCIICGRPWWLQTAHYIGRAQGGLGIPQNLVTLCRECHEKYDNGDYREEYGQMIHDYLKGWYPDLDKLELRYDKYRWLNEIESTTED